MSLARSPVRWLSLTLLAAACAHGPFAPDPVPVTDPALLERFAKDLLCARDEVQARGESEIIADGCGRIGSYSRRSDGSWSLVRLVDVNAGKPIPWTTPLSIPRRLSGRDPVPPRAALNAHANGLFIGECTITTEGDLRDCVVEKSLEHWDHELLSALETWKYAPVTYRGKPVAVRYKFRVRIQLP